MTIFSSKIVWNTSICGKSTNIPAEVSTKTKSLREHVASDCMQDILHFFSKEGDNGQIVIYDAVNASVKVRRNLHQAFSGADVQTIFVESVCDDDKIIQANVRNVKVTSPDYEGWDPQKAVEDYLKRINAKIPHYEQMSREHEPDLSWVKMINIGDRMVVNKGASKVGPSAGASGNFGYLGEYPLRTRAYEIQTYRFSHSFLPHESTCETPDSLLCSGRKVRRSLLQERCTVVLT